jgi:flagellar biosynthetic protein FliO
MTALAVFESLLVVALVALAAWAVRRVAPRRPRGGILVETASPLGERRSLVIVSVEGRRLLLGLTPTQVSLVAELGATPFNNALDSALTPGGRS